MQSKLLKRLEESESQSVFPQSLSYVFQIFSSRVSKELKQINILFDEYTPHDDTHMGSLLRIADDLLGDEVIGRLNECEACVLACAIYGHDWGMAVSEDEKEAIVTGAPPDRTETAEFALLPDERDRWRKFTRSLGIGAGPDGLVDEPRCVSKDHWRDYVRQTHAERARVRAIKYFESEGDFEKLGMPVGEVCAGHWYEINDIRRLSTSWSIGGLSINLQALAIYMRFIDLLDIGINRTPYALWKFINPRNVVSAMEWRKHRAINPVTYRIAPNGDKVRVLQIHGETDDHTVYAALQDLKRYIEDQVTENVSALRGMEGYSLGRVELEWIVKANGFEPIDIRFEFDRSSMFDVVSREIYDGDPYVFIRELLQNAIDATDLRKRRIAEEGLSFASPTIRIIVEHHKGGDAKVTVTDEGTGMDAAIVRHYLAVVGKSYYRSKEFRDLDTGMTPISRFGIGILSCFEVADRVSITTRMAIQAECLEVQITDRNQQFRVQRLASDHPVGTSVTVWVKGTSWRKGEFSNISRLDVTGYVKVIAGFVPFPIMISESGKETIICSILTEDPGLHKLQGKYPSACVARHPRGYGLDEAVVAQDVGTAPEVLEAHTLPVSCATDGVHIDGFLGYFTPTDSVMSSTHILGGEIGRAGASYQICDEGGVRTTRLRWRYNPNEKAPPGTAPSARYSSLSRVFFQGILMPEVKLHFSEVFGTPPQRAIVNIVGNTDDLIPKFSRLGVRFSIHVVKDAIMKIFIDRIKNCYIEKYRCANLIDRLSLMARLASYVAPSRELLQCLPVDILPILLVDQTGRIYMVEFQDLSGDIEIAPKFLFQSQKDLTVGWSAKAILNKNVGGADQLVRVGVPMAVLNFGFELNDGSAIEWKALDAVLSAIMRERSHRKAVRLGLVDKVPYLVEIRQFGAGKATEPDIDRNFPTQNIEFCSFEGDESAAFFCLMPRENDMWFKDQIRRLVFNSNHPVSILLQQAISAAKARIETVDSVDAGRLRDAFHLLPVVGRSYAYRHNVFEHVVATSVRRFCFAVAEQGIINLTEAERTNLSNCASTHFR